MNQTEQTEPITPDGIDLADGKQDENPKSNSEPEQDASQVEIDEKENLEDITESEEEAPELSPLEQAEKDAAEFKDAWQRERADFSNYRKRMMQEKSMIRESATGNVIQDLLEALDNLDRVLIAKSENAEVQNFVEGVRMIQGQFYGVLGKHNVEVVAPQDQAFDPFSMEAIATEVKSELKEDTVLEVFQVGYVQELSTGKHVLRPARVKVGKPEVSSAKKDEEQEEN